MKVCLVLFIAFISIFDFCIPTKVLSMASNGEINTSSKGLAGISPLSSKSTKHISMMSIKEKPYDRHKNLLVSQKYEVHKGSHDFLLNQNLRQRYRNRSMASDLDESRSHFNQNIARNRRATFTPLNNLLSFSSRSPEDRRKRSEKIHNVRLEKRSAVDKNGNTVNISKGRQKKAKALGRLLMNSVSNKNYDDIQDDYIEDEDDDYSKGVNGNKMNWEDYQNEDGASVMELIALNTRHKTNMRQAYTNEYLY